MRLYHEACQGMALCFQFGTYVGEHGHREETTGIGVLLLLVTAALPIPVMPLFRCQMQTLRLKSLIQVRVNFARYRMPQHVAVNISCGGCLACMHFL